MLRKDSGAVTGWLAYSFSHTRYRFDGINQDRSFFPRHDRSSVVNAVSNVDIRNAIRKLRGQRKRRDQGRWSLGTTAIYGTGQPYTEPGSAYIIRSSPIQPGTHLRHAPTIINNIRLPAYARLDVSLTYRRDYGTWSMEPYVQLFNAGNRRNVWFINYDFFNGVPDIDEQYMFPVLPSFGVNFTF